MVIASEGKQKQELVFAPDEQMKQLVKPGDWNELAVIARGNNLIQKLNGRVTVVLVDNAPQLRASSGLIALQLHRGPAMTVQFRNVRLRAFK
jgi:hypothetical protein